MATSGRCKRHPQAKAVPTVRVRPADTLVFFGRLITTQGATPNLHTHDGPIEHTLPTTARAQAAHGPYSYRVYSTEP
jgi:hypothetical protein